MATEETDKPKKQKANKNFIGVRVPLELYKRFEAHLEETQQKATQVVTKALAAYLNFPIEEKKVFPNTGVSLEMFQALVERVQALEELLKESSEHVITDIDTDNEPSKYLPEAPVIRSDYGSYFESFPDPWLETAVASEKNTDNNIDNIDSAAINTSKPTALFLPLAREANNQPDNADNMAQPPDLQQPKLFNIQEENTSIHTERGIAQELNLNRNKLRRHVERIEAGEIPPDAPLEIECNGQRNQLTYLGKPKGRKLWKRSIAELDF